MPPGERYQAFKKNNNQMKRGKLNEGRFHHSMEASVERMLFTQMLCSNVADYVGPVCV